MPAHLPPAGPARPGRRRGMFDPADLGEDGWASTCIIKNTLVEYHQMKKRLARLQVLLEAEYARQLEKLAKEEDRTVSGFLRRLLIQYLKDRERKGRT